MVKKEIQRLMLLFLDGYINRRFELILVPKTNLYFRLEDIKTVEDLQFEVIAWCSRDACKAQPYFVDWRNENYRKLVRDNINTFLGTNFDRDQWMDIYTIFGNACNKDRCREFIRSNFNFDFVKNLEVNK